MVAVEHTGSGTPDREIGELAARQQTIITRRQLLALGLSAGTIARWLARGRLYRVHHGVYSIVPERGRPRHAAEWAAVLACGSGATLSHATAAGLHGLEVPRPAMVQLTIVTGRRDRPGLEIHRSRRLARDERHRITGLPITSVARTVVDLAPACGALALEHLIDEALRRTSRTKLSEAVARHAGRPGVGRLARLLDPARPSAETWSRAERQLLILIRQSGLPLPEANQSLGRRWPDLVWRAERVIVEFDSFEFHSGPRAFSADRDRHNQLVAEGWQVIHITWTQLTERPAQVLVWIATALARGAGGQASWLA